MAQRSVPSTIGNRVYSGHLNGHSRLLILKNVPVAIENVTYIDEAFVFYVALQRDKMPLKDYILKQIQNMKAKELSDWITNPVVGNGCIVQVHDSDGTAVWHRGEIRKIWNFKAEIYLVDVGDYTVMDKRRLLKLTAKLQAIQKLAVPCRLYGASFIKRQFYVGLMWFRNYVHAAAVAEMALSITVQYQVNGVYSVKLLDPSRECISKLLISKGYCRDINETKVID